MTAPAGFLDPALLARIGDLALLARNVVDGFMHGLHKSRRVGLSLDFAEHRAYQPGDDIRRIDWRVYGRTDRYYVKEYEADTNASVNFALDASGSMDFGSGPVTKFDYGRFLVASLAGSHGTRETAWAWVTFAGDLLEVVPHSTRHLQLDPAHPWPGQGRRVGKLPAVLERAARSTNRAGIVVVCRLLRRAGPVQKGIGALRPGGTT